MRAIAVTKSRVLLVLAMIAAALMWGGSAAAATKTIELCAKPGTIQLPGVPTPPPTTIWGFGIPTTPGDCSTATASLPGPGNAYIGTGAHKGEVRVLVHTQRWTGTSPSTFSTWGNLMKIVYDAP